MPLESASERADDCPRLPYRFRGLLTEINEDPVLRIPESPTDARIRFRDLGCEETYERTEAALYVRWGTTVVQRSMTPCIYEPDRHNPLAFGSLRSLPKEVVSDVAGTLERLGFFDLPNHSGFDGIGGGRLIEVRASIGGRYARKTFSPPHTTPEIRAIVRLAMWWIYAAHWRIRLHLRLNRSRYLRASP